MEDTEEHEISSTSELDSSLDIINENDVLDALEDENKKKILNDWFHFQSEIDIFLKKA